MPFRLCSRGLWMVRTLPVPLRRAAGTAIASVPARKRPVSEAGFAMISSGVPTATTWPPCSPAPGPRSTT